MGLGNRVYNQAWSNVYRQANSSVHRRIGTQARDVILQGGLEQTYRRIWNRTKNSIINQVYSDIR